ncbi:MAG: hypothetical protein K2K55_10425 [Duncaniella sp.]|nr:hypothetical protein [Duncaniella sp.]
MRLLPTLLACAALACATCGCRDNRRSATPLPEGYPRIETPDASYVEVDSLPVRLMVNKAVTPRVNHARGAVWIDLIYPSFSPSAVYLTLSEMRPDSLDGVLRDLSVKMQRNTQGQQGELTTLTSEGGWDCRMIVTPSAPVCPVQILAIAPDSTATLFGTLYLNRPFETTNDSIRPVIDTVERDLTEMLKCLK